MRELPGARVAIVTPTLKTLGGTEVYLQRLIRVQRSLGLSVRVFTQDAPGDEGEVDGARVIGCGDALSEAMSPRKLLARAAAVRALAGRIAESADWVEFHRIAPIDLLRALRGRVHTLVFAHTPELTCPALGRYLPRSGLCCDRPPGAGCLRIHAFEGCLSRQDEAFAPQQRLRALVRGPLTRALADAATAFVFNSEANRDLHLRTTVAPPRCFVLQPPLDILRSDAARVPNRLLFCGRLEVFKGALDAVRVAAALPEAALHIYGAGGAESQARELASRLGERVEFRGWQDAHGMARAYAEASCVLMPSRSYEAWGMVGPEAIAAGCPVVAFDTGGVREWLEPEFGEIVPVGDMAALTKATARQLDRMRSLDTSSWRARALSRWGEDAFRLVYARTVVAACARDGNLTGAHRPVVRPASGLRRLAAWAAGVRHAAARGVAAGTEHLLFKPPTAKAEQVLIYRIGTMGDHSCAAPAIAAIRERHADASLTLVTEKRGGDPWPVQLGFAREFGLTVREYGSIGELRQITRDVVPDALYYLAPQPLSLRRALRDAMFFRAAGVRRAVGFDAVDMTVREARQLQPWRESQPEALRLLRACKLKPPAGLPAPLRHRNSNTIVFAPAGKTQAQRWPEARFIDLAHIAEWAGFTPVWLGDEADARRLLAAGALPGINRMGGLSPAQLRAEVAGAAAVVSNDTGIAHLAALAGTPVLVIATARTLRGSWSPWGSGPIRVLRRRMNCEGCYLRECEDIACLTLIHVEEAWQALSGLLANQKKSGIQGGAPANAASSSAS